MRSGFAHSKYIVAVAVIVALGLVAWTSLNIVERRYEHLVPKVNVNLRLGGEPGQALRGKAFLLLDVNPEPGGKYFPYGDLTLKCRKDPRYDDLLSYRLDVPEDALQRCLPSSKRTIRLHINTCTLANGYWTASAYQGVWPADGVSTPDIVFSTRNNISKFKIVWHSTEGDPHNIKSTSVSADLLGATRWRVDVLKGSGKTMDHLNCTLIRSAFGEGPKVAWVWDGTDAQGKRVPDRKKDYTWTENNVLWPAEFSNAYFYRITAFNGNDIVQQTPPLQDSSAFAMH